METPSIDPRPYVRPPRTSVRSGLSLGRILLRLVPEDPGPGVLSSANTLEARVNELDAEWKIKQREHEVEDVRPYDARLDRNWGVIESSLDRYSQFAPEDPDRIRARTLHQRLFPTGLDFLRLPYIEQHAESERRVDLIAEEGLREDLDRLVGTRFIEEMLAAHTAYGTALGIDAAGQDALPSRSLRDPLRRLNGAISSYAIQLLAFADLDPEHNVAPARRALAPIETVRRAIARRNARRADDGALDDVDLFDPTEDMTDSEPTPETNA